MGKENQDFDITVIVAHDQLKIVDFLMEKQEITYFHQSLKPFHERLEDIYHLRKQQIKKDNELSDYVETLLLSPALHGEVKQQGLEWFYSKMQLESFREKEKKAASVIAHYAFALFQKDKNKQQFSFSSQKNTVCVFMVTL